jgi:L-lactate dehydrogenase complex protein LldF
VHLVLLDNGRSRAYADERFRATLQCIRCGACMNHCPVYTRIGGLAYGTTYPGPIGKIISPHLLGLEATHSLVTASSLCGACGEVCPVRIPIPELLVELRTQSQNDPATRHDAHPMPGAGAGRKPMPAFAMRAWAFLHARPALYRLFSFALTRLRGALPRKQGAWTESRAPLRPAARSLHELLRNKC